jgi:hypothetical protein
MSLKVLHARMRAGERAEPSEEAVERAAGCGAGALGETSARLVAILGGDTGAISALRILHLYMERLGCDFQVGKMRASAHMHACMHACVQAGCL